MNNKSIEVVGFDVSLNHGAAVKLIDGELFDYWYYTTLVGSSKRHKNGCRIDPIIFKNKDKQIMSILRLGWLESYYNLLMESMCPDYCGIENYALNADQGAHYIGEGGGILRLELWRRGVKFRLHDPLSVKMFTAHDGTCSKDAIVSAVKNRWDVDFSSYDQPLTKSGRQNTQTSEDLCDAFAVAQLVWTEVQLRTGNVMLSDLHEKEIRVFNRVTKSYPINLLDREWIYNDDGFY